MICSVTRKFITQQVYKQWNMCQVYTDKKKISFSSYIRKFRVEHAVAKSFMKKGFLIYEEMRKYFPIYEEAVGHI